MAITAADVKALREATGAGMMECKKALTECNGDMAEAEKYLKEKGLAAMANTKVEADHEAILEPLKVSIRENMKVAKVEVIDVPADASASFYVHSDKKTGAVVVVKGSTADVVKTFAYDCCLHIAAFTPSYLSKKDVPESYVAEQKEIFKAQMDQDEKMAGKPENVKEGILQGKINKHLAEICFEDQMFVKDDKKTVTAKLAEVGKEAGASLSFATAKLFVLGK